MESHNFIDIDGGIMEGGGQILRMAIALSSLLKKPIRVSNIRANRSTPGLRSQHLTGLELIRDISKGDLSSLQVGSMEMTFNPGTIRHGNYVADAKTAGSVSLLFQVTLPCLIYGRGTSSLLLKGGTNLEFAPQIDFITEVLKPQIKRFGIEFDCQVLKRGYYPKGGGCVSIKVNAVEEISPIKLIDRGQVTRIYGKSYVAGVLPIKVAHQMAESAAKVLRKNYSHVQCNIEVIKENESNSFGTGSGIILVAETENRCLISGSAVGKKGVQSFSVGAQAAKFLESNLSHGGCVDEYLQDQLVIFLALASGKSIVKTGPITLHTKTAIHIVETLTEAKFKITEEDSNSNIIECEGISMKDLKN